MWAVTHWVLSYEDQAVMTVLRDVVDRMQVRSRTLVTYGGTMHVHLTFPIPRPRTRCLLGMNLRARESCHLSP
jgi:hypothetical protein